MAKKKSARGTTPKIATSRSERTTVGDAATESPSSDSRLAATNFEDAMQELEEIVQRMESGGGSLDSALDDYALAIKLVKVCHQKLEKAERRIEILSGVDADGNPITTPFEDSDDSLEEKQRKRSVRRSAQEEPSSRSSEGNSELF